MSGKKTLYEEIGAANVEAVITEFYIRAFQDPIISHFFVGKSRDELTRKQIEFAASMLGSKAGYSGRPLDAIHRPLPIRKPHFGRRQVLMREVLLDKNIPSHLAEEWLRRENLLYSKIVFPKK